MARDYERGIDFDIDEEETIEQIQRQIREMEIQRRLIEEQPAIAVPIPAPC